MILNDIENKPRQRRQTLCKVSVSDVHFNYISFEISFNDVSRNVIPSSSSFVGDAVEKILR